MSFPLEDDPLLQDLVDDSGEGTDGSAIDKAFLLALAEKVTEQVYDPLNPTVSPGGLISEIVAARGGNTFVDDRFVAIEDAITIIDLAKGSMATIQERLDVSTNPDGTLKSVDGGPTVAGIQSLIGSKNLWWDSLFNIWPAGSSAAPSDWVLTGSGATVARTGVPNTTEASAPADTTRMSYGQFAAKLTFGAATATLKRTLIASGYMPEGLKGRTVAVGVRAKASAADSRSSLVITDGVNSIRCGSGGSGTFITTTSETWAYGKILIDASATKLEIYLEQNAAGDVAISAGALAISDYDLTDWFPERHGFLVIGQHQNGSAAVETTVNEFRHPMEHYCYLQNTRLNAKTAPTTTAIVVKPKKGTATDVYATTFPQIAAAATQGAARPDGTYGNRCFAPGDVFTWNITQVGTGTVGEEVNAGFTFVTYPNEWLFADI